MDKRSGVSQRLPISTMELVISNAERRALLNGEALVVPRVSDIHAAAPGISGKLELEYEGEMRGADTVVEDLIRTAVGKIYDCYFEGVETDQIEMWFNLGGAVKLDDTQPADSALAELCQIQGLMERLAPAGVKPSDPAPKLVAAAEFLLEGLVAHRKLSRNEERGFVAAEHAQAQGRAPQRGDGVRRVAAAVTPFAAGRLGSATEGLGRATMDRSRNRPIPMKRIHYTKYRGDLASEIDLEDLLQALSDYFLNSGYLRSLTRNSRISIKLWTACARRCAGCSNPANSSIPRCRRRSINWPRKARSTN